MLQKCYAIARQKKSMEQSMGPFQKSAVPVKLTLSSLPTLFWSMAMVSNIIITGNRKILKK